MGRGYGRGYPLPRWGLFGNLGTTYRFFVCIIKFELTSTLAPKSLKIYMISVQGVGETVSVVKYNALDTKERVWEPGTLSQLL